MVHINASFLSLKDLCGSSPILANLLIRFKVLFGCKSISQKDTDFFLLGIQKYLPFWNMLYLYFISNLKNDRAKYNSNHIRVIRHILVTMILVYHKDVSILIFNLTVCTWYEQLIIVCLLPVLFYWAKENIKKVLHRHFIFMKGNTKKL